MYTYVAFLRAINVGGRFVTMESLRQAFDAAGLEGARTFIQTGNVWFRAASADQQALEQQIEAQLQATYHFAVPAFLRTPAELAALAAYTPFHSATSETATLNVAFLRTTPDETQQAALMKLHTDIDELHVFNRHVFWRQQRHLGESKLAYTRIERALKMPATVRNITTVRKLNAAFGIGALTKTP